MDDDALLIRINAIRVLGFPQDEPETPVGEKEQYTVNVTLQVPHNRDENRVRIILDVSMRRSEDPASPVVLSIKTVMEFEFKDDTFLVTDKEGIERVRPEIQDQLVPIAYSTTRGILFTRVGLSGLTKLLLPLLDTRILTKGHSHMPSD